MAYWDNYGEILKVTLGGVISITGVVLGPLLITQQFDVLGTFLLLLGLLAGLAITGENPNQQLIERYSEQTYNK